MSDTRVELRGVEAADLPLLYGFHADEEASRLSDFPSREWPEHDVLLLD